MARPNAQHPPILYIAHADAIVFVSGAHHRGIQSKPDSTRWLVEAGIVKSCRHNVFRALPGRHIRNQRSHQDPGDGRVAIGKLGHIASDIPVSGTRATAKQVHDGQASVDTLGHGQAIGAHTPIAMGGVDKQLRRFLGQPAVFLNKVKVTDAGQIPVALIRTAPGKDVRVGREKAP